MTLPRSRRHRSADGRRPVLDGDFPDGDRDITETLQAVRPASWDGTTITFGGASAVGLPPHQVYQDAGTAAALRQAIELTAMAERGPGPTPAKLDGCTCTPPSASGAHKPPCPWSMQQAGAPPARLRALPPPGQHDDDKIARDMARGWPHLFEVRCAYPAAASDTPIPCGAVHRDGTALSFRALRTSAWAAGWHLDALGRWACPGCCQESPGYRTPYPVTVWAEDAAARRGEMWDVHVVYGGEPVLTPLGQVLTVAAEHVLTARAEHDLFRAVRAARARHAGSPR